MKNLTVKLFFKILRVKVLIFLLGLTPLVNLTSTEAQKAFPQETNVTLAVDIESNGIFQNENSHLKTTAIPNLTCTPIESRLYLTLQEHKEVCNIPQPLFMSFKFPKWSKCTFT
ncbi:MAG TPA: hypothetical protein PKX79_02735 [Spirochaetota bacterium]|nr:hypothetical protein [Spirochaetota bacterium]